MHYIDHFGAYMGVMCNVWRHIMHVNVPDVFIISTFTLHSCIQAIKTRLNIMHTFKTSMNIYASNPNFLHEVQQVYFSKVYCTYIVSMKTKKYFCIVFIIFALSLLVIIKIARLLIMCRM